MINKIVKSKYFEHFIIFIIVLNSIALGLETVPGLNANIRVLLESLDRIFLGIFVLELVLKLLVYRKKIFKDYWNYFDFFIILFSLLPFSNNLSILRSFRIIRALRVISTVPQLKKVASGLFNAIPGLTSVFILMLLFFYVGSVITTKIFSESFPQWFGDIGKSSYSLFQIMTLESWSMGIVRPIMEKFPYSWIFFIPFILIMTFTMLNLFIAVIVNALNVETEDHANQRTEIGHIEREKIIQEIQKLRKEIHLITQNPSHLHTKNKMKKEDIDFNKII